MSGFLRAGFADGRLQPKWVTVAAEAAASSAAKVKGRMSSDLDDLSIDADDADERYRDEHEPTCRGRTLQFLESNPLQVVLYVMVLLDAVVVTSEILLDLHAMRSQYRDSQSDLVEAMSFINETFSVELSNYNGDNIRYVLRTLRSRHILCSSSSSSSSSSSLYSSFPPSSSSSSSSSSSATNDSVGGAEGEGRRHFDRRHFDQTRRSVSLSGQRSSLSSSRDDDDVIASAARRRTATRTTAETVFDVSGGETFPERRGYNGGYYRRTVVSRSRRSSRGASSRSREISAAALLVADDERGPGPEAEVKADQLSEGNSTKGSGSYDPVEYYKDYSYSDKLLKIAHILHYFGIAILAFFVIHVSMKIFGMGLTFFKKKFEIFDTTIVMTSFALDLVFIEGITGDQTEEAIALLMIFLLWRILRIVNGIMVTSKKRQEFRIQLLKRARRRAQKKIEYLEDDKNWKEREIANLKRLCSERGAHDDEIAQCKPRRRTIYQKMDTSVGLSTIASLSLGVSMSMTGTGRTLIKTLGTAAASALVPPPSSGADRRRNSVTQLFRPLTPGPFGPPVPPGSNRLRRASFVELVHPEGEYQRLGAGQQRRRGSGGWLTVEDGKTVTVNALTKPNAAVAVVDGLEKSEFRKTDSNSNHCNSITSYDKPKGTGNNTDNTAQRMAQLNKIQRVDFLCSLVPEVTIHAPESPSADDDDLCHRSQGEGQGHAPGNDRSSSSSPSPSESRWELRPGVRVDPVVSSASGSTSETSDQNRTKINSPESSAAEAKIPAADGDDVIRDDVMTSEATTTSTSGDVILDNGQHKTSSPAAAAAAGGDDDDGDDVIARPVTGDSSRDLLVCRTTATSGLAAAVVVSGGSGVSVTSSEPRVIPRHSRSSHSFAAAAAGAAAAAAALSSSKSEELRSLQG